MNGGLPMLNLPVYSAQFISHTTRKVLIMHQIKVHFRIFYQRCAPLEFVMAKQTAKEKDDF